jgi:outer membrane protein assembly factor BamB
VVAWRVPVGYGDASPVVAGGKVYYLDNQGNQEIAHALDVATGSELWHATIGPVFADAQSNPGPRCAPVVDGDRVYVQSCRGELQCLSATDGKMVWRAHFVTDFGAPEPVEAGANMGGTRHGNSASPVIDGARIYVAVGSPNGASVVCFDKRSGKVLWKSQNDPPGHGGPIVATIAGVKQLVVYTATALIGLDLGSGALLWRVPIRTQDGRHVTTPLVFGDVVVVGSITAGLVGVRVTKSGATLSAARAWTIPSMTVNYSSPVAIGAYVYGLGPMDSLISVNPRDDTKRTVQNAFFSGTMTTGFAGFLAMGGNLLVLTDGGWLMLITASPQGGREIARTKVCGHNWCIPAYAGGRLYLRDDKELRCLKLVP